MHVPLTRSTAVSAAREASSSARAPSRAAHSSSRAAAFAAAALALAFTPAFAGAPEPPPPAAMAMPTKAVCRVCEVRGSAHGLEDVAAWRDANGTPVFFCSDECAAAFDGDPLAYAVATFPRPAPAALVRSLEGASVPLESLRGSVTLVDFWATWCKPCLKSMPKVQKLHDALGGQGFRAVGVAIDEGGDLASKSVREFVRKKGLTYSIVLDDESTPAWAAFHVAAVPAMYLIDRRGDIVMQWSGEVDFEEVERAARAALQEAPPTE